MAARLVAAVLFASGIASVSTDAESCGLDECGTDDNSLLALKMRKSGKGSGGTTMCKNRFGIEFPCGEQECCGDICVAKGGTCCKNTVGNNFVCAAGDTCCGDACAAKGNFCCAGVNGQKYPVAKESECVTNTNNKAVECKNRYGVTFPCGEGSTCCGDVCAGEGSVCCKNDLGYSFPCGAGSTCCGNACAAPGSKCCDNRGVKYPVSQETQCATSLLSARVVTTTPMPAPANPIAATSAPVSGNTSSRMMKCKNRFGIEFPCGEQECCGDICVATGGTCCKNTVGNNFVCAAGDTCCGDACASKGNFCCAGVNGQKYPVAKENECVTNTNNKAVECKNRYGVTFPCGEGSTCCGDVCAGEGSVCCKNDLGYSFPCGAGSTCCGNACAAPGSKCCDNKGVKYPVSQETHCAS